MLRELKPLSCTFPFGEVQLHLRYDMNALLELENAGLDYVDIFAEKISRETIFRFFYSGLVEKAGKLRAAEIFKAAGALKVWEKCIEAVLLALPEPDPLLIPNTKQHENNGEKDGTDDKT